MEDQTINTTQKRLRILGDDETQALYGRPHFTDDERLAYFALEPTEKAALDQLHSIKSRIYFILQLGYFRQFHDGAKKAAKERVYELQQESNEDLDKAAQVLKLFTDERIPHHTPFAEVQAKAFSILEASKIDFVADHLTKTIKFDETAFQWEHLDGLALQFIN